jgi:hypothetical protein
MKILINFAALRQVRWYEHLTRFLLGGLPENRSLVIDSSSCAGWRTSGVRRRSRETSRRIAGWDASLQHVVKRLRRSQASIYRVGASRNKARRLVPLYQYYILLSMGPRDNE